MAKILLRHRYKEKEIFQTRKLVYEPYDLNERNMSLVIGLIARNLTPKLLSPKYREENKTNPKYGHCYHSTQALFYLMNTDKLKSMSAEDYRGEKHWWLQNETAIYDVTMEQYYSVSKLPPYDKGKESKWYGWQQRPHQRTLDLMVLVLGERLLTDETFEP